MSDPTGHRGRPSPGARQRVLGALLSLVIGSACASIMGVEEPTRRDSTTEPSTDGGPATPDLEAGIDGALQVDCIAPGCPCGVDADCKDQFATHCVAGRCMECTTEPDSCGANRYCVAGAPSANDDGGAGTLNKCAPGCSSDNACAPPLKYCNLARHQCVTCKTKDDCAVGQDCSPSGTCADTCTADGGTCADPTKTCCNQLCVDLEVDVDNCGQCAKACVGAETQCCAGACSNPLTTVDHCGNCATKCVDTNGTPRCEQGGCDWTCTPGFSHCAPPLDNTGCETATSSIAQCGGCNTNCANDVKHAQGTACSASFACTYSTCNNGYRDCNDDKRDGCECECGGNLEPCCTGGQPSCNSNNLVCVPILNRCSSCGGSGELCCSGNRCNNGLTCSSGTCRTACKGWNASCSRDSDCCSNDCSNSSRKCR